MSSPFRCIDAKRLHRDRTTAEECKQQKIGDEEKARGKAVGTTPPSTQPSAAKRGRGRPRKHPVTPTPAPVQPNIPTPPSTSHRSILPLHFGNSFTPNATQEDPVIPNSEGEEDTMTTPQRPPPPFTHDNQSNNSPTSTDIVPETVFNNTPQVGQPGPSNWHYRRSPSLAPEVLIAPDNSEHIHSPPSPTLSNLLNYRDDLACSLADSTGLVHRLRTRNKVHEANAMVNEALLVQALEEQDRLAQTAKQSKWLRWVVVGLVLGIGMYVGVCWVRGPEMEYVRRRRGEVLRE